MTPRLAALGIVAAMVACRGCPATPDAVAPATSQVVVSVRPADEGGWLLSWDGGKPRELTVPPDAATLAVVGDTLARTHPPASTRLVLSTGDGIPLAATAPLADALRRRGFVEAVVERAAP
jgi:hypothetical protein